MTKHTKIQDEEELSDDSAELIQKALASHVSDVPSYAKLHHTCSITKNKDETYDFNSGVNNVTPSPKVAYAKYPNKCTDPHSSSDDLSIPEPPRKTRNVRCRTSHTTTTKTPPTSSYIPTKQCGFNDKLSGDNTMKKSSNVSEHSKTNEVGKDKHPSEITVQNKNATFIAPLLFDPTPNPRDFEKVCPFCHNVAFLCHEKRYSNYCYQAVYSYLQDKNNGLLAVFSPARLESVYMSAYNEIRRVDMFQRFGYYTPGWLRVPKCMELNSMKMAADMGYYPDLCEKVRKGNEHGRTQFIFAKSENKS